jgi:hypothetical protein
MTVKRSAEWEDGVEKGVTVGKPLQNKVVRQAQL